MKISGDVFKLEASFSFFTIRHLQSFFVNDKAVDETKNAPYGPSAKRRAISCLLKKKENQKWVRKKKKVK